MKRFRKVYIEITNICNMHCSFCPETKRTKATMSACDFEYVAKEVAKYTDYVYLHVKGEPLIHPELEQILDICDKYNLKVNISTNGTLLKNKWRLLKNIRQLNVSLHSFEDENDEKLERYLKDTLDACDRLAKEGVIIRYKLWNAENDEAINNKHMIRKLESWYNTKVENTTYLKDIKLRDNMYVSIKTPFKWPDITNKEESKQTTCYGLRHQIAILVDGTVVPCCVDNNGEIALGNVFETSLEKIINSKEALEIKRGFEENKCKHNLCKSCEYRTHVIKM